MKTNNFIILILLISVLFGCGENDKESLITEPSITLDSAISKYESYLYKDGGYGGTITLPLYQEPKSFNPYVEPQNVPFMYEGLVKLSGKKISNNLVDRVEVSEDSLTWRLKLKNDLLWSDSVNITVDDVVFTYNDALKNCDKSNVYYSLINDKVSSGSYVLTIDSNDGIVFKLRKYTPLFKEILTIPILPKHKYKQMVEGSFCDSLSVNTPIDCMVGSGPFIIAGYAPFGRVVFVKNRYYHRKDYNNNHLPYLDTVKLMMLSDIDEALNSFKSGDLDFLAADGVDLNAIKKSGRYNLFRQDISHNGNMILFNPENSLYKILGSSGIDVISRFIPRSLILDSLLNNDGAVDAPLSFWFNNNKKLKSISVSEASSLLKDLGFKKDNSGSLVSNKGEKVQGKILVSSANGFRSQMAHLVSDLLQKLGINLEVNRVGAEEFLSNLEGDDWGAALTSYDEGNSLRTALQFWSSIAIDSGGSSTILKLSDTILETDWNNEELKKRILSSIKQHVPAIFLVRSSRNIVASKRLYNVNPSPFGGYTGDISKLYVNVKGKVDDKES